MKKHAVQIAIVAILVFLYANCPAHAGGPPLLALSTETEAADCQLGSARLIDAQYNAHLFLNNWSSANAYKAMIEKPTPLPGEFQSWEGAVMSILGTEVGIYQSKPILLSWTTLGSSDISWRLFIKPRDEVDFQEVDISQSGRRSLWVENGNNCWSLAIIATNISSAVPEPASLLALLTGIAGLGGFVLRKCK